MLQSQQYQVLESLLLASLWISFSVQVCIKGTSLD